MFAKRCPGCKKNKSTIFFILYSIVFDLHIVSPDFAILLNITLFMGFNLGAGSNIE